MSGKQLESHLTLFSKLHSSSMAESNKVNYGEENRKYYGIFTVLWKNDNQLENKKPFHHDDAHDDDGDDDIPLLINILKEKIPYFVVYNVFPCIMHAHNFGPNFPGNGISAIDV